MTGLGYALVLILLCIMKTIVNKIIKRRGVRQFVKFSIVGSFNTIIDFTVYLGLTRIFGLYFLVANIVSGLVAMTFSFFVNKHYTFRNGSNQIVRQYTKFAVINIIGFGLNNTLVFTFVEVVHLYDVYAKISAIAIVLFWNFFAQKYWAFATHNSTNEPVIVDEDLV